MTPPGERDDPRPASAAGDIVGTWIREDDDETAYPDELTFEADGIYRGTKAAGSKTASKLDVGVFERTSETSIRISTSTDLTETFSLDADPDVVKLVDEEGRKLSYRRRSSPEDPYPEPEHGGKTPAADEQGGDQGRADEWVP